MKKSCAEPKEVCNINEVLCFDVQVKIFMALNVAELPIVSLVCKTWKDACHDPALWKKLDLNALCFNPFNIPKKLGAWEDDKSSSARMTRFLKNTLSKSDGNISCLVFNFYAFLRDGHLIFASKRTPNLKRLVLPHTGQLSKAGIDLAMRSWRGLQSMTVTGMVYHQFIFSAIGKYCKGISELKFTCHFQKDHADALVKHTPNLKTLSLQSVMVNIRALLYVLKHLQKLEVVNVCHSLIYYRLNKGSAIYSFRVSKLRELMPKCVRKLVFCQGKRCSNNLCKNKKDESYHMKQTCEAFEDIWRQDEIRSLAH